LDFHQLRVFVEVARQKNFSRAAEKIFLTQPTVSAHIKALENEIGAPLLDRNPRELQLTPAGKLLFQYAQQLLNLKKRALFDIQQEYQIIRGHLELAASSIPSIYVLPGLMKGFLTKHPEVTFAVMHRDTQQVFECIKDFTYDLGFIGEPVHFEGLTQVKLLRDDLILAAAPGTVLPGEKPRQGKPPGKASTEEKEETAPQLYDLDLRSCASTGAFLEIPFIMREPGSATRIVFENALKKFYRKEEAKLRVVAYIENQEAIKEAVKAGLGVTVISYKAVHQELAAGLMKGYRMPDLQLERNLYLIYRNNCVFSPLCQAFLEHCLGSFKAED
jgi:DNA-binding transcriptional LysR family regulator